MFLWELLECVVVSGVGQGGAVAVGVAAVLAQVTLSLYGEVRFLFATMGNRSLTVKVVVSAIPFLILFVYAMVSAISFGSFLFSPTDPYLADLMRSITLTVERVLAILAICLPPFLRLAVQYLLYKLAAFAASTAASPALVKLIDSLGSAFGLVLGMAGSCGLLLAVSVLSSILAVSV